MAVFPAKISHYLTHHWLTVLGITFFGLTAAGLVVMLVIANRQAQVNRDRFNVDKTITEAKVTQVRRIKLSREGEDEVVEILLNGQVNIYDKNGKLIKSGLKGFYDISTLFAGIENNWGALASEFGGSGKFTLEIETNQGTTIIEGEGNGGDGGIIDDIGDTGEEILNPSPTPTPEPTIPPGSPTPPPTGEPTPTPSSTPLPPGSSPTPTPSPTPLPPYMVAPPFTCEDYQGTRPKIISNIICGLGL